MNKMDSKALQEVLEWKEKAYQEVQHLQLKKALNTRISESIETTRKLHLPTVTPVHK